jgi:hypothetical protein
MTPLIRVNKVFKIYFCCVKWKACIALIVLSLTVLAPAAQSLLPEPEVTVFLIDEEKSNTGGKMFNPTEEHLPSYHNWDFAEALTIIPATISQLPVDRALDLQTPPPDFC